MQFEREVLAASCRSPRHSSSVVEHSIRNRAVVGSIPTCGSLQYNRRTNRSPTCPPRSHLMKAVRGLSLAVAMFACAPLPQTGDVIQGSGGGTSPAITAADLSVHMYAFAHDSMQGRQASTEGGLKAARYLAAEAARIGLEPAGDGGTFYQLVPLAQRSYDEARQIKVDGQPLTLWAEYLPRDAGTAPRSLDGSTAIYGGNWGDTASLISREQAAGKVVVIMPAPGGQGLAGLPNRGAVTARFSNAAAIAVGGLEALPPSTMAALRGGQTGLARPEGAAPQSPLYMYVTAEAARKLLGH